MAIRAFPCPECGARVAGERPGQVVACPRCANPVVVPEARAPAPPPVPAASAAPSAARLWSTAGAVLAAVAVAHLGLYLLLTMEAREGLAALRAQHAVADLEGARRPGPQPEPGTAAYAAWNRAQGLWLDRNEWETHRRHTTLLAMGLSASFAVQVAITGWVLARLLHGRRRQAAQGP